MKLYYSPGACSLSPHIVLREVGVPFSLEKVDLKQHTTESGRDFYQLNPKGYVPVLELDNGERLTEGTVISQYVSELAQRQDLLPPATQHSRYRVLEWQNYVSTELHKGFSPLFNPLLDAAAKAIFSTALNNKYRWISQQLEGQRYLTGDTFTIADAYLYTVTRWAAPMGLDLRAYPALLDFMHMVEQRPAVVAALQAERLLA